MAAFVSCVIAHRQLVYSHDEWAIPSLTLPVLAHAQTLTDKEYQRLRDASLAIIREMGVECGGSNVQMAVNPKDGEVRPLPCPTLLSQGSQQHRHVMVSERQSRGLQIMTANAGGFGSVMQEFRSQGLR